MKTQSSWTLAAILSLCFFMGSATAETIKVMHIKNPFPADAHDMDVTFNSALKEVDNSASVLSPRTAASATRALNVGVWLRRDLLLTSCSAFSGQQPVRSRLSTYPAAQISGATSLEPHPHLP